MEGFQKTAHLPHTERETTRFTRVLCLPLSLIYSPCTELLPHLLKAISYVAHPICLLYLDPVASILHVTLGCHLKIAFPTPSRHPSCVLQRLSFYHTVFRSSVFFDSLNPGKAMSIHCCIPAPSMVLALRFLNKYFLIEL